QGVGDDITLGLGPRQLPLDDRDRLAVADAAQRPEVGTEAPGEQAADLLEQAPLEHLAGTGRDGLAQGNPVGRDPEPPGREAQDASWGSTTSSRWWGTTARSSGVALALPMSRPR